MATEPTGSQEPDDLDLRIEIERHLETLKYREREIIKLRWGLGDGYTYTLADCGRIFKRSTARIWQIEQRAIQKLTQLIQRSREAERLRQKAEQQHSPAYSREVLEQLSALTPELVCHLQRHADDVRKVKWQVFEHLVAELLAPRGFSTVRLVGRNPHTAADVLAVEQLSTTGARVRHFVEAKRWKDKIGIEVIDRVYGAMQGERHRWGWHLAMIVSLVGVADLGKYTRRELELMGIELRQEDDILRWLREWKPTDKGLWLPHTEPTIHLLEPPHPDGEIA